MTSTAKTLPNILVLGTVTPPSTETPTTDIAKRLQVFHTTDISAYCQKNIRFDTDSLPCVLSHAQT